MDLPNNYGKISIKFDENKNPEYGFIVKSGYNDEYTIEKFVPMTEEKIDTIVLPKLIDEDKLYLKPIENDDELIDDDFLKYIYGKIEIDPHCFCDVVKAKIVVPFVNSVRIDPSSFTQHAQIEFLLDENLSLRKVDKILDLGPNSEHKTWFLITNKNLALGTYAITPGLKYIVQEYDEKKAKLGQPTFKTSYINTIEQLSSDDEISMTL